MLNFFDLSFINFAYEIGKDFLKTSVISPIFIFGIFLQILQTLFQRV